MCGVFARFCARGMDKLRLLGYTNPMSLLFDCKKIPSCKIALGLSGGRDSMALANALKEVGADFFAVNFEHGIRGESSVSDSLFVKNYCEKQNIELLSFSFDVPKYAQEHRQTTEQAARELRYAFFENLVKEGKCEIVAVAHHADDLAETVLMRILRGTGVRGLIGMKEFSGVYWRPMLDLTRERINEYVEENKIPFVEDETNAVCVYTRNFLREEIKRLKERFPSLEESFLRLSRNAAEVNSLIEDLTPMPVVVGGEAEISISKMAALHDTLKKCYIRRACEAVGVMQDIEEKHYALVFSLAERENGKKIELTHGLNVHRDNDFLVFEKKEECVLTFEIPFAGESVEGVVACEKTCGLPKIIANRELFVDGDKIPTDAVLRNPKIGDVFPKFGGGTKNLGDFLTDKKIPLRNRKELIVCVSKSRPKDVLFIVGVEISNALAVDGNTRNILKITKG